MPSKIHLIAPSAPPKVCGVGDHSFLLGAKLAERVPTLVHCGQREPEPRTGSVDCLVDFDHRFPWTLIRLARTGDFRPGDTLLFQYTNFAYGRYGFNPWLAPALRQWRKRGLKIATMFHETYMPAVGVKIRMMGAWQRVFFRQVGLASDLCLFSVAPWVERYGPWFPGALVETLAVGSNIPRQPVDRQTERRRLGLPDDSIVLGVFGGPHPSRLTHWVNAASQKLRAEGVDHRILRIGPNPSEMAMQLPDAPLVDLGVLEPADVSRALACCDLFLSPISDGASSRRGSLLAGLGHGLACLSNLAASSDDIFRSVAGDAIEYAEGIDDFATKTVALCRDPARRSELGAKALSFHDRNFGWDAIAERFIRLTIAK